MMTSFGGYRQSLYRQAEERLTRNDDVVRE